MRNDSVVPTQSGELPLKGIRILDLTRMLTGDYAAMILGDMGAEIIKIEDPDGGDPLRTMPPHFLSGESAYFLSINRNKKSITLNLTKPKGQEVFYQLVSKSDVVFDNFRPGILEKLGADYLSLRKYNPRIIACSISSYGATGPYKDMPGFDLVIQALSGAMSITGEPGRDPVRMGIPMGDLAGSMFAAYSISAALYGREKTGSGCRIDLSLLDCLISLLTYVAQYYFTCSDPAKAGESIGGLPVRLPVRCTQTGVRLPVQRQTGTQTGELPQLIGSGHMSVVPYRVYKTTDGHLTVAIFVEKFWGKLCEVVGRPEFANDPKYSSTAMRLKNRAEVDKMLEERFATDTTDAWIKKLYEAGIPAAPVNTIDKVFANPQVLERNMKIEINHPKCGKYPMVGNPIKITGAPDCLTNPPPTLGQHTEEILRQILDYKKSDIEQLKKDGII
jgi:crotonobetainyl-CoA:carnitine CoA-transferase CaiB-like acyl-CoA transferase